MHPVVKQIHRLLIRKSQTVAVAESCTAGLVSFLLTQFSGSSKFFTLGVVTYSNSAKNKILGIPFSIIDKRGAVSKEVALLLAQSVRKIAKADFGIGITGIAGPTGATPGKPVGTVFIAISAKTKKICKKFFFKGNRSSIRQQSALNALKLLKQSIS
jgi:nicotinamide-nucleotide amidase